MIRSMTGFGEARHEDDGHEFHVEIRSVNNRYFKAVLRLPDEYTFLESTIEQPLRQQLARGSVTFRLSVRDLSGDAAQDLNLAALRRYLAQLEEARGATDNRVIDMATLALLPGVCQPRAESEGQRDRRAALILKLTEQAIARLLAMRSVEGRALQADLSAQLGSMRINIAAVRELAPQVVENYRQRLMARVSELLADRGISLGADDLIKEVAIFAERSDVNEELSRLESHVEQFDEAMAGSEPPGRKLDFISQELLREANTIGSKAGDARIARLVIELKGAIDRIKEQVQNVE